MKFKENFKDKTRIDVSLSEQVNKMTVIICDDDEMVCDFLERQIKHILTDIDIVKFSMCGEVYEYLKNKNADGIFMDIEFTDGNSEGITSAAEILRDFPGIKVIFFTGYSEKYIEEIFTDLPENNPYGIIKKPVDTAVLEKYLMRLKNTSEHAEYISFKDSERGFVNIDCRKILYITSFKRIVRIYISDNQVYAGYYRLNEMFENLSGISDDFYYCHKSYVVNMKKITCIPTDEHAVYINKHRIPLSSINGTTAAVKKKYIIKYNS